MVLEIFFGFFVFGACSVSAHRLDGQALLADVDREIGVDEILLSLLIADRRVATFDDFHMQCGVPANLSLKPAVWPFSVRSFQMEQVRPTTGGAPIA